MYVCNSNDTVEPLCRETQENVLKFQFKSMFHLENTALHVMLEPALGAG